MELTHPLEHERRCFRRGGRGRNEHLPGYRQSGRGGSRRIARALDEAADPTPLDAARAFATAHHATTRGCLVALDDVLKRRRPRTLLDLGTGTGILAIAAAEALGRPVLATDNDPVAVFIAAGNARKAGVGALVRTFEVDGLANPQLTSRKPDLILANLLERPLYRLAPAMARNLAPSGGVILSGLTAEQAGPIEARYRAHGFTKEKRIILDGWTTLVLKRRSARVLCD
jgi:ribosomal protein L11 methyltransferase